MIAGILQLARRVAMPFLPELHGDADTRAWVASWLLPRRAVWVAERDGRVVGYAALADRLLEHLYVEPDSQGRGVGSALLARVMLESPERLELWTFQRNTPARRFYERRGFRAVESTDGAENEEREPDVRYVWKPAETPARAGRDNAAVDVEREKQIAAESAAELVENGMVVGLGTGSTVAYLLPALAARSLDIHCVATSPRTERAARELRIPLVDFNTLAGLDMAIDGSDQIAPDGWLVKGGGEAHTREKLVAAAADRFVVIAHSEKLVTALHPPVPVELLEFGLTATLRALDPIELRDAARSPDGGLIADYLGPVDDPAELAARLSAHPGVVEHGLFPPAMVAEILIGRGETVEQISLVAS